MEVQVDEDGKRYIEVEAITAPDSGLQLPVGSPVPLNDGYAYFFTRQAIGKKGKAIKDAFKQLMPLYIRYNKLLGEDNVDAVAVYDEVCDGFEALVRASLAANYKAETVDSLIDKGLVDVGHLDAIISICQGQPPDYELRVKKKMTSE